MQTETFIGPRPPHHKHNWDCQCARCGSSADFQRCDNCEDGFEGHDCGEDVCCCLHPEDNVICQYCRGYGGWHLCLSSADWCQANPLPGRESVERGEIEWFPDVEP